MRKFSPCSWDTRLIEWVRSVSQPESDIFSLVLSGPLSGFPSGTGHIHYHPTHTHIALVLLSYSFTHTSIPTPAFSHLCFFYLTVLGPSIETHLWTPSPQLSLQHHGLVPHLHLIAPPTVLEIWRSIANKLSLLFKFLNTVKDCASVTDKYVVFIQPHVVFHFLEDFVMEPAKLGILTTPQWWRHSW